MTACFISIYFSPRGLGPVAAQTLLSIKQRPPHDNLLQGTFYLRIFSRHLSTCLYVRFYNFGMPLIHQGSPQEAGYGI